jgi:predicted phage replisome organizer
MAEVKWIKLTTDMFDNRKIKHLRRLPDGNNIVLIWVMLLTMAGRCNSNGMIFLTENIPYTPKMLADELDFEENTVQLALGALEQLNMIVTNNGFFSIAGWEEYQNIEGMERIREQNRLAQQRSRAKRKLLQGQKDENDMSHDSHMTVTECHAIEEDKEKEQEIEEDKKEIHKENPTCQQIVDLFNSTCVSLPSVRSLSEARKKAIKARLNTYTIDDFKQCFENAQASSFLKGSNPRNWTATFDWLIKDANMAKVLDGNYVDNKNQSSNSSFDVDDFFNAAVERTYGTKKGAIPPRTAIERATVARMEENARNGSKTVSDDPDLQRRAEELKKQFAKGG